MKIDDLLRWAESVEIPKDGKGCWRWKSNTYGSGYGRFKIGGKGIGAHRAIYEHYFGPLGQQLCCHTCDNKRCVNPHHLFAGTHKANADDAASKGRLAHGDKHPLRKISFKKAEEVRQQVAAGRPQVAIALELGLSRQTVSKIVNNILWRKPLHEVQQQPTQKGR